MVMHRQYVSLFLEKSPINFVVYMCTQNYIRKAQRGLLYVGHMTILYYNCKSYDCKIHNYQSWTLKCLDFEIRN